MSTSGRGYALAGTGSFARFCLQAYREIEELRLVSLWNRTEEKAARTAAEYGMHRRTTLEALCSDPDVDLVHVATIPSLHAAHAQTALECGKHVLCEKPLATDLAAAEGLCATAERRGVRLGVNFVMRYGPFWLPVKTLTQERLLGRPLRAEIVNCASNSGLSEEHWFWDQERSGGIFVEHGVHFFDLLASWFGQEGVVTSARRLHRPQTGIIDQVVCNVQYDEWSSAGFYHGFHQPHALDRQRITLIFERGEITLHGWVAGKATVLAAVSEERRKRIEELFPSGEIVREANGGAMRLEVRDPRNDQSLYKAALVDLMRDFLQSVNDPAYRPRVDAKDAVAAVRTAVRARELSLEAIT